MVRIFSDKNSMSLAAASLAATRFRQILSQQQRARLIAATGASQLSFLEYLAQEPDIAWNRVELFHLDEYIGIGPEHPASFARYIQDRVIKPLNISSFHLLNGAGGPTAVIREANAAISATRPDLAFVGVGENGHLAFNDPPADFETEEPHLIVELDRACRQQQVNEGWFAKWEDVPPRAISMSVRQILKSKEIICVVPGPQKANAVRDAIEGPICPEVPASILREHPQVTFFLDTESAAKLTQIGSREK